MNKIYDAIGRYDLLKAAIYAVLGVLIVSRPNTFFQFAVYILAGLFALMGVFNLIVTKQAQEDNGGNGTEFTSGILLLIGAVVILIFAKPIVSVIPFFLGLFILLSGIRQLVQEVRLSREGVGQTMWLIFSIVLIVLGGVLVFNPFKSVMVLFQVFGGILILLAVAQVVQYFQSR